MNPWLQIILLSIVPAIELRGSIPLAFYHGLDPYLSGILIVIVNSLATIITFLFLDFFHVYMMKFNFYKKTFDAFMERTRHKAEKTIAKYGYLGLAIFVAVPLPGTGAYTGALAAWFFNMDRWKAFWSIAFGVLIAGIIVTVIISAGIKGFDIFVGK